MSTLIRRHSMISLALAMVLLLATLLPAAERKLDDRAAAKPKSPTAGTAPTSTTSPVADGNSRPADEPATSTKEDLSTAPAPTATTAVVPTAGETLTWLVLSGGGGSSDNGAFKLDVTIGQTASGLTSGGGYKLSQGFWQDFGSGSCCIGTTGNVNMTGIVDLGDLSALVSYLTGGGYVLPCTPEANVNNTGIVDLGDLSALVSYLTGGGYVLPTCP